MFFPPQEANVTGKSMPISITYFRRSDSRIGEFLPPGLGMAWPMTDGRNGLGQQRHVWRLREGECKSTATIFTIDFDILV